jgi:hypothetical protein
VARCGTASCSRCAARRWLELYRAHLPELLAELTRAHGTRAGREERLTSLYAELTPHDFSRALLQASAACLRLAVVPPCGWTDLGTPDRVASCLAAIRGVPEPRAPFAQPSATGAFDLAHAVWQRTAALSA